MHSHLDSSPVDIWGTCVHEFMGGGTIKLEGNVSIPRGLAHHRVCRHPEVWGDKNAGQVTSMCQLLISGRTL